MNASSNALLSLSWTKCPQLLVVACFVAIFFFFYQLLETNIFVEKTLCLDDVQFLSPYLLMEDFLLLLSFGQFWCIMFNILLDTLLAESITCAAFCLLDNFKTAHLVVISRIIQVLVVN